MNRFIFRPSYHLIVLSFSALFILVACQSKPGPAIFSGPPPQSGPPPIPDDAILRVAVRQGSVRAGLRQAIDAWTARSSVEVELYDFSYAYLQTSIFTDVQTGHSQFDVILIDDPWFPSLVGNGYLIPLSEFGYEADKDFVQRSLDVAMWPAPEGALPPFLSQGDVP